MAASIEITGLRTRAVRAPFRRTLNTRVGRFTHGPFLLVDLDLKGGGEGRVLAFTFTALAQKIIPLLLQDLAAFLKGRALAFEEAGVLHDACQKRLTQMGHEGLAQMALSILDMALHDAWAREAGLPLYRLLGAESVALPAYNSCGLGIAEPAEVAREAAEMIGEHRGFTHLKLRMGRARIEDELAAYRAVRDTIGPGPLISVDFNQSLPVETALATCRAIDGLGLTWIEEPVVYDDYDTQAALAAALQTPIQVGENWWSWRVGKAAIERKACDYIMPDLLRIGGVTGWRRLAETTGATPFSSHLSPDYSAHVLAATSARHWLEYVDWGQDLIRDPLTPNAGYATPREAPGTGVEWNEKAIAACLI